MGAKEGGGEWEMRKEGNPKLLTHSPTSFYNMKVFKTLPTNYLDIKLAHILGTKSK